MKANKRKRLNNYYEGKDKAKNRIFNDQESDIPTGSEPLFGGKMEIRPRTTDMEYKSIYIDNIQISGVIAYPRYLGSAHTPLYWYDRRIFHYALVIDRKANRTGYTAPTWDEVFQDTMSTDGDPYDQFIFPKMNPDNKKRFQLWAWRRYERDWPFKPYFDGSTQFFYSGGMCIDFNDSFDMKGLRIDMQDGAVPMNTRMLLYWFVQANSHEEPLGAAPVEGKLYVRTKSRLAEFGCQE